MRSTTLLLLQLLAILSAISCEPVAAQVVQLPVIRNFSVSGSAMVPDGGTAVLGGANYSSAQSSSAGWGPYSSRAGSVNSGGGSVSVSATVIDLAALDEAILARAGVRPPAGSVASGTATASGGAYAAAGSPNSVAASAAAASAAYRDASSRRESTEKQLTHAGWIRVLAAGNGAPSNPSAMLLADDDLAYYLRKARDAEQANRPKAAEVYYRMLLEKMDPELRTEYFKTVERRELEALAKEKDSIRRAASMKF